jgi:hypothetical protein
MQEKPAGSSPPLNATEIVPRRHLSGLQSRVALGVIIFMVAFGVRVLTWHDTRLEVGKVQTAVVADYQRVALLLRDGGVSSFFSRSSPLSDLNNLGHPPGYSLLLAAIYSFKQSDTAVQFVQIAADALSAVMIFLILSELFSLCTGVVAGLLAALSPQLAWNSVLLLPDSISVLPILIAVYLLTRALRNPRLITFLFIGIFIGLSCWLRANAMLLTLFFAAATLIVTPKHRQFALIVVCGALLIVLPLTIRNAIVFHRFVPLSLGAGQTFLEGIADYDKDGRLGVPATDMGIMKQEAELYQRPDYYGTLFNPDGVERERARLSRGFAIVRAHPFWFAGVMAKRGASMLRLERSRLLSREPAITHGIDNLNKLYASVTIDAEQLETRGTVAPGALATGNNHGMTVSLSSNSNKYGEQFRGPMMPVRAGVDYVVTVPLRLFDGRMRVNVENIKGKVYASEVIEYVEGATATEFQNVRLPFATIDDDEIQVVWANEAATARSAAEIGWIQLYELGPAKYLWTHGPRLVVHAIQKLFITAVVLPMAICGLLIVILKKQSSAIVALTVVPIYFFTVQSAVHTEYRYVIAVSYFLFAFAGIAMGCGFDFVVQKLTERVQSSTSR